LVYEFPYLDEKVIFDFFRYGFFIIVKIDQKLSGTGHKINLFFLDLRIVFLLIRKRDRDRRVHERPLKNDRQYDFL